MSTRLKRPSFWRHLALTLVLIAFQGYLAYNVVSGQFGVENNKVMAGEIEELKARSGALAAEIEATSHRVALFNQGRIGFFGTVEALAAEIGKGAFLVDVEADGIDLDSILERDDTVKSVTPTGEGRWQIEADGDVRAELARKVVQASGSLKSLDLRRARLDEAYRKYFEEIRHEA